MRETVRAKVESTFSSLRVRNFRLFFVGQSVSLVGTWMQSVTQSWLVFRLTNSGFDVGLVVALQTLPILVLGPLGGTIADRWSKYQILFWTQAFAGLQAAALAILAFTHHLPVGAIYAMAVCLGLVNMVDNPTRQTFIGEMVGRDDLANAVTLNSVMVNLARAVGPAIAGILIAVVGSGWCFLVNAISFVFVLSALAMMRSSEMFPAPRVASMKGQLVEGLRYVARERMLRNIILMMAVIGCLTYEFQVSLPLMAGDAFHGNSVTYGVLTSSMGLGAVVGGLMAAGRANRTSAKVVRAALVFGAVVLLAALAPTLWAEVAVLLFVGGCSVTFMSYANATLQLNAEPAMRGRVMSLWSVAFLGSTPIGGPIVGLVGAELGARYAMGLGGAAALVAGAVALRSLRHRREAQVMVGAE